MKHIKYIICVCVYIYIYILEEKFILSLIGAVKITPAHDRLDYNIAKRHNLPIINVINEKGNMTNACRRYKVLGKSIKKRLFIYLFIYLLCIIKINHFHRNCQDLSHVKECLMSFRREE